MALDDDLRELLRIEQEQAAADRRLDALQFELGVVHARGRAIDDELFRLKLASQTRLQRLHVLQAQRGRKVDGP